ncbi:hypothetical protein PoB_003496100 [Plakobranchus ocellatus]|uniref:Uncharacterized protein n=1 Tax=Plakobranchus ocellatus TaxID=259542 RepID=A0AAV4ABD8_9GAST|nr:hypothetical protein PoB_003496100 [Plakobranchus ocellatus]
MRELKVSTNAERPICKCKRKVHFVRKGTFFSSSLKKADEGSAVTASALEKTKILASLRFPFWRLRSSKVRRKMGCFGWQMEGLRQWRRTYCAALRDPEKFRDLQLRFLEEREIGRYSRHSL